MKFIDCIQGSDEWYLARVGKVTASRFSDVLAKGEGKTRLSYMKQLRAERLTGIPSNTYSNSYMEWGTENEPLAREYYEETNGVNVQQIGFAELNEWIGCSPDGLVDDDGIIEIKCPKTETHLDYIDSDEVPTCYYAQIQGNLWVTDRQWCDFVSFDPRIAVAPYFCKRVKRDKVYIKALDFAVQKFIEELKEMIARIDKCPF